MNWYDYGARFYDPQIARFHSVDPLAELYYHITPYRYGLNNPMRFVDAFGLTEEERITALQIVRGKLGTPYSTMDCSALVGAGLIAAGKENYKNIPGIGQWQGGVPRLVNMSRPIRRGSMLPGDLVTFKSTRDVRQGLDGIYDHIGMVSKLNIVDGKLIGFWFIHARSSTGATEDYYDLSEDNLLNAFWLRGVWAWEWDEEDRLYNMDLEEVVVTANGPEKSRYKPPIPQIKYTGAQQGRLAPGDFGYIGSYWDTYDRTRNFGRKDNDE